MFPVESKSRRLKDETDVSTLSRGVDGPISYEVEVGSTYPRSDVHGKDERTYIRVEFGHLDAPDVEIRSYEDEYQQKGVEIVLKGEGIHEPTIEALRFIVDVLEGDLKGINRH